ERCGTYCHSSGDHLVRGDGVAVHFEVVAPVSPEGQLPLNRKRASVGNPRRQHSAWSAAITDGYTAARLTCPTKDAGVDHDISGANLRSVGSFLEQQGASIHCRR